MSWGRLDDKLHENSKAWTAGTASMGLWLLANSWCCDNLQTDGFVPTRVLLRWSDPSIGDDVEAVASRLVDAGLWHPSKQGREDGYLFHDWDQYRPGSERASVDARRGNHVRWHARVGVVKDDCEFCQEGDIGASRGDIARSSGDDRVELSTANRATSTASDRNLDATMTPGVSPGHSENDRGDIGATSGRVGGESLPVPVPVPVPEYPNPGKRLDQPSVDRPTDPLDFERFWDAYPRHIGKGQARKAWKTAAKKADPDTIIIGASAFTARVANTDPKFIPYPSTWLNSERWTDEPDPNFSPRSSRQTETDGMFDRAMSRAIERDEQDQQQKAIGA